jgi:hypothetical protein
MDLHRHAHVLGNRSVARILMALAEAILSVIFRYNYLQAVFSDSFGPTENVVGYRYDSVWAIVKSNAS